MAKNPGRAMKSTAKNCKAWNLKLLQAAGQSLTGDEPFGRGVQQTVFRNTKTNIGNMPKEHQNYLTRNSRAIRDLFVMSQSRQNISHKFSQWLTNCAEEPRVSTPFGANPGC